MHASEQTPPTLARILLVVAVTLTFVLCLFQSVRVTVAWWQGRIESPGFWEWLWIGLLPVWLFIYVRYFSIFRPGCRACELPDVRR